MAAPALRKLSEEEKEKITFVVNDFFGKIFYDSPDPEYITEFDIFMKEKLEEFKLSLLKDNEPLQIEALMYLCEDHIKEGPGLSFLIWWEMWLNKSLSWPVRHNPEWEEWEKLKDKKVRRKDNQSWN